MNLSQKSVKMTEGTLLGHYVREDSENIYITEEGLFEDKCN